MSKPKKAKAPAADFPVPASHEECDAMIKRLGEVQRDRERLETSMNAELAQVKAIHEDAAQPLKAEIERLTKGVQLFCEARRFLLTRNGESKTYRFAAGEVSWRARPPSVTLKKVKDVLAACLEERRWKKLFVRTKHEIDREAMLGDPTLAMEIPGVSIGSAGENFTIKPFETELEEVAA